MNEPLTKEQRTTECVECGKPMTLSVPPGYPAEAKGFICQECEGTIDDIFCEALHS